MTLLLLLACLLGIIWVSIKTTSLWVGGVPRSEVENRKVEWLERPLPVYCKDVDAFTSWSQAPFKEWPHYGHLNEVGQIELTNIRFRFLVKDLSVEEFLERVEELCLMSRADRFYVDEALKMKRELLAERERQLWAKRELERKARYKLKYYDKRDWG